jgi:AcrR family transcriptional regulator
MPFRRAPSQERSRETVNAVFEAAMRELSRGDPSAVNVNRVAQTAGVSIGSIYQYFPSKDALLTSLIEWFMRRRFEAIMDLICEVQREEAETGSVTPLEEIMRRLVGGTIRFNRQTMPIERALIAWFARVGSIASLTQSTASTPPRWPKRCARCRCRPRGFAESTRRWPRGFSFSRFGRSC